MSLLCAFEAAARHQSFTAAAAELHLTQSAVSRQIRALEDRLGAELFVRERQTVRLTAAGQAYAQEIRGSLMRIANATLSFRTNPQGGQLNLAILPTFGTRWLAPRLIVKPVRPFDAIAPDGEPPVLICGFGRVGQIVGRVLRMRGIPFTALEQSAAQIDVVRRFGNKVYYGDPSRLDLLRAAGADKAKVLVVALEDMEQSLRVVELAKRHFPHLVIHARARNRRHAHFLMDRGVTHFVRETYDSSLRLTGGVLESLGLPPDETRHTLDTFRKHDERTLIRQHAVHHDENRLIQTSRQAAAELQALFEADREEPEEERDRKTV